MTMANMGAGMDLLGEQILSILLRKRKFSGTGSYWLDDSGEQKATNAKVCYLQTGGRAFSFLTLEAEAC